MQEQKAAAGGGGAGFRIISWKLKDGAGRTLKLDLDFDIDHERHLPVLKDGSEIDWPVVFEFVICRSGFLLGARILWLWGLYRDMGRIFDKQPPVQGRVVPISLVGVVGPTVSCIRTLFPLSPSSLSRINSGPSSSWPDVCTEDEEPPRSHILENASVGLATLTLVLLWRPPT